VVDVLCDVFLKDNPRFEPAIFKALALGKDDKKVKSMLKVLK